MKRAAWRMLPIVVFAIALTGALAVNISLVSRSRNALASTILRNPATVRDQPDSTSSRFCGHGGSFLYAPHRGLARGI
jgi:hypothetical protein